MLTHNQAIYIIHVVVTPRKYPQRHSAHMCMMHLTHCRT
jgi:hypothetical protein